MFRYIFYYLTGAILVLVTVALFNYSAEQGISLLSGDNQVDDPKYTEAYRALDAYQALDQAKVGIEWQEKYEKGVKFWFAYKGGSQCYVMGSSRVMMITADNLDYTREHCETLVNLHGPSYYTLEMLKFMGIVSKHPQTKSVLIDVTPWILTSLHGEKEQIERMGGAREFLELYRGMNERDTVNGVFFNQYAEDTITEVNHEENQQSNQALHDDLDWAKLLDIKYFLINVVELYSNYQERQVRTVQSLPLTEIRRAILKDTEGWDTCAHD